jgi:hypothetical protein
VSEKKPPCRIKGIATLAPHVNETYGVDVAMMTELDMGVLRIEVLKRTSADIADAARGVFAT